MARAVWDQLADAYDSRHGDDGNKWHRMLVEPAVLRMLPLSQGLRVLDLCCGSGMLARRLDSLGATVTGADGSDEFLSRARLRSADRIRWVLVDATDEEAIAALGTFDAVVSTMAVMDLPDIAPLFRGVQRLLHTGGPFVVVTAHPAFNHPDVVFVTEDGEACDGDAWQRRTIRMSRYLKPYEQEVRGVPGQPVTQRYFHRPLSSILAAAFGAGFVLDALEEPSFREPSDGRYDARPEIPPVLAIRLRAH